MTSVEVRPFEADDAPAVARLATTVQWPSLTDAHVVRRVSDAPGAVAFVAVTAGEVVGWAQAMGDGVLQSHLGFVAVHPDHRRRGIARLLVTATFQSTGALRMDLVAESNDASERFYAGFAHRRMSGFRLYPGASLEAGDQDGGSMAAPNS